MKFTALSCLLIGFLFCPDACSQLRREGGVRLLLSEFDDAPQLMPVGENGLIMYRQLSYEEKSGIRRWEIEFYDRELNKVWNTIIDRDYELAVTRHTWFRDNFYLLFEGIRNLKRIVQVFRMNVKDKSYITYPINSFTPSTIFKFDIFGNSVVLGGIEKVKPSVVLYKFEEKRPLILQGLYSNKIDLVSIDVDNRNELVSVVTSFRNPAGKYCIGIRSYDRDGHDIENLVIEPPEGIQISQGTTSIINSQYRVVSGIFRNSKEPGNDGVYISRINVSGEQYTKYYNFNTLFGNSSSTDSLKQNSRNLSYGSMERLSWIVSDISVLDGEPVILTEGFEIEEQGSPGLNPRTQVSYIFQKGLAIIMNVDMDTIKSIEINMNGHSLERLRGNLFLIPSDSIARIAYFNVTRLGMINLNEGVTPADRYFISLLDLSAPNSDNTAYQHRYSAFQPWFGKTYLYTGIVTDKNERGENVKSMFVEKIVFD